MSGINTFLVSTRTKCPHCNGHIDLREFVKELFLHMATKLHEDGKIQVDNFGVLKTYRIGERTIKTICGKSLTLGATVAVKFHASQKLKAFLNKEKES